MSGKISRLQSFHETIPGHLLFSVVEMGMAYGFASWAIDSGRLLAWSLAIIMLAGGLRNAFQLVLKQFKRAM